MPTSGVPGAVAVELVHNFSLLHDDIIDGDRERRHQPTVWALFGVGQAILVGDALQTLAHQVLLETRTGLRRRRPAALADAVAEMIAGQAEDVARERRDVDVDGCIRMAGRQDRRAAVVCIGPSAPCSPAPTPRAVDALAEFGAHVGLSFQAVDDMLGIWGDPAITGQTRGLRTSTAKKKTLPVAFAMAANAGGRPRAQALFRNGNLDEAGGAQGDGPRRAGGRPGEATEEFAASALSAALAALDAADLDAAAAAS